jgi:hypothetical protein
MNVEELKQNYLSFGGREEELENISDEETLSLMCDSQQKIHSLLMKEKEGDESGMSDIEKLQFLKESLPPGAFDSDEVRQHQNSVLGLTNKIRARFNLEFLPLEFSDKDLTELLALDDYRMNGMNCSLFLKNISDIATRKNYEQRLRQISTRLLSEESRAEEYYNFVSVVSENLSELEKNPPEKFLIQKDGSIKPNRFFETWKNELLEIRRKLTARIRADASVEKDSGGEFKADKRTSVYKLHSKVEDIIKRYHLEE